MKFSDLKYKMKTGDIILFSGTGVISNIIKVATNSMWSHVGMVVIIGDTPYLFESTTLNKIPDYYDDMIKRGVQVVNLEMKLQSMSDYKFAYRELDNPLTYDQKRMLYEIKDELFDTDYEQSLLELIKSSYDGWFGENHRADLSTVFCSELTAYSLQKLGVIGTDLPPNEYVPSDFSSKYNSLPYLITTNVRYLDDVAFDI